jgi:hypothetical protein
MTNRTPLAGTSAAEPDPDSLILTSPPISAGPSRAPRPASRAVRRVAQSGRWLTEEEFAELLDYIGSSDVRVRVGELREQFPP